MFKVGDEVIQTEKETPYLTLNEKVGVVVNVRDGCDGNFIRVYFEGRGWNSWLFRENELTHVQA